MIFRELSNAAFRFSLRWPGAEIMGGVQTPPPQQAVENPEAQQGAGWVLSIFMLKIETFLGKE